MVQISAVNDSSFSTQVKRYFTGKKRSCQYFSFSGSQHSYMHSTQLSEVASNLIGQGRHDREKRGLMAE